MADTDARPADQEALVADIDRTRASLARTIDAISERVSPKRNVDRALEQARQRVSEVSERVNREVGQVSERVNREVSQRAGQIDPVLVGAAAAAVLVGVTVLFLVRRRRR
jgi:tetrahydromethanopterin S-methyltransferase subunit G